MGKITGWKIVKQNTKKTVYEHKEPFRSAGSLLGYKTTQVQVEKHTTKTKTDDTARRVGKNKWVHWECTIEPPSGRDYFATSFGRVSSKQKAHEKAVRWMRKHPRGAPKRPLKKPEPRRCRSGDSYVHTMWM